MNKMTYTKLDTHAIQVVAECEVLTGSLIDEVQLKAKVDDYIYIDNQVTFD